MSTHPDGAAPASTHARPGERQEGNVLAPDPSGGATAFLLEGTSDGLAPEWSTAALVRGPRLPGEASASEASPSSASSSTGREGATTKASSSPDEMSQTSSVNGPTLEEHTSPVVASSSPRPAPEAEGESAPSAPCIAGSGTSIPAKPIGVNGGIPSRMAMRSVKLY